MKSISFYFKNFSFIFIIFLFAHPFFSYAADADNASSVDETKVIFEDSTSEKAAENPDNLPESRVNLNLDDGYTGIGAFVKMIVVLAIFAAAVYLLFRFIKKQNNPGNEENPFLRKAFQLTLGPGKTVQIITLVDSAYILGVSDSNVNLIEKIDDKELVNAINLYAEKNSAQTKPKSFSELLDIFMPNKNRQKKEAQENDAKEILNGIRNRVKSMEDEE